MSSSLKIKTVQNVSYNAAAKITTLLFSSAANIILAQYLLPYDYGIIGFAMVFINFLTQFSDIGINSAVIQKSELDEETLYTAFSLKSIIGVLLFISTFLFAPLAKIFLKDEAIERVIQILLFNFIIITFTFLPTIILSRELNYKKLSLVAAVSGVVNSGVSIVLALNGFRYWSIVIASICTSLVSVVFINILKPVKFRFSFNKEKSKEIIRFSGSLFVSGVIVFAIFNFDNFVIGAVNGTESLGYYSLAFTWGSIVCLVIGSVISAVLFPTFSKMQNDRGRLKNAYLGIIEYIGFVVILLNLGLFVVSEEFLYVILGRNTDKWMPALTTLRILCLYGISRTILEPIGSVIIALGKTGILLRSNIVVAVVQLGLLYPVIKYMGIEGVAVLVTVSYSLQYLIYFPYFKGELNMGFKDFFATLKPSLISSSIVFIMFAIFENISLKPSLMSLIVKLLLTSTVYIGLYGIMTNWKFIKEIRSLISNIKD